jgi:hypothetical protein
MSATAPHSGLLLGLDIYITPADGGRFFFVLFLFYFCIQKAGDRARSALFYFCIHQKAGDRASTKVMSFVEGINQSRYQM